LQPATTVHKAAVGAPPAAPPAAASASTEALPAMPRQGFFMVYRSDGVGVDNLGRGEGEEATAAPSADTAAELVAGYATAAQSAAAAEAQSLFISTRPIAPIRTLQHFLSSFFYDYIVLFLL
jgi:hypothetical protein